MEGAEGKKAEGKGGPQRNLRGQGAAIRSTMWKFLDVDSVFPHLFFVLCMLRMLHDVHALHAVLHPGYIRWMPLEF